jgi:four helix bundle protein
MPGSIRDLKVWQEAVALAAETVKAGRHAARRETKVVTDQLMVSAVNAASTIADAYGRYTAPEQRLLYRGAKRELLRLETQLAIARQADLINAPTHAQLASRVQSVTRLLGGYLVYLERQLGADAAEGPARVSENGTSSLGQRRPRHGKNK